ncbi:hypothetical protein [Dactylosporangium sp. CA-092794]|uniref:hypothetical protein n=1 Tax=Dactylosporangium sp. CA-092794 TaxID=3239929 RepID=UPI003D8FB3A9
MRDWIAVIVAVLGVLLVLAGAVLIVLQSLEEGRAPQTEPALDSAEPTPVARRLVSAVKNPSPADRLIFWGVVLLVLAAIAAGAISFDLGARGGN